MKFKNLFSIKNKYTPRERKKFLFAYMCVLVPVLQLAIFWFYVNLNSLLLAFTDNSGRFTFGNFELVYQGFVNVDRYGFNLSRVMGRTLSLWFLINIPVFFISICSTYVLFRRVTGHYIFRVFFLIPGLVGAVVWTVMVKSVVAFDGPIIKIIEDVGFQLPVMAKRNGLFGAAETAFPTLLAITAIRGIVGGSAVMTGAFTRIPGEIYDVGKLDGVGFWREFFTIIIPSIWPTLATLISFALCGLFTADGGVFLFTNGTGEPEMATMGYYLYYMVFRISHSGNMNDFNYPAAVGLAITLISVPVTLTARKFLEKAIEPVGY